MRHRQNSITWMNNRNRISWRQNAYQSLFSTWKFWGCSDLEKYHEIVQKHLRAQELWEISLDYYKDLFVYKAFILYMREASWIYLLHTFIYVILIFSLIVMIALKH